MAGRKAGRIAACPALGNLRTLDLGDAYLPAGLGPIVTSASLAGLEALLLTEPSFDDPVAALRPLACPGMTLTNLRHLHLGWAEITDPAAEVLAAAPGLARLEVLDLTCSRIGPAGARALADSPHLGRLRRLVLTGNSLDRRARARLRERFGDGFLDDPRGRWRDGPGE